MNNNIKYRWYIEYLSGPPGNCSSDILYGPWVNTLDEAIILAEQSIKYNAYNIEHFRGYCNNYIIESNNHNNNHNNIKKYNTITKYIVTVKYSYPFNNIEQSYYWDP